MRRHTKGSQLQRLHTRHTARLQQEQAAQQFAARAAWLSPPIALPLALERIAGMGPEAASGYRAHVVDAFVERLRWVVVRAWEKEPLDRDTFEALLQVSPAPFVWQTRDLMQPSAALGLWLLASWLVATRRLQQVTAGPERR